MSVKVSPISRFASLLIIAIGIFTLLVGWATGILEDSIAGIAFIILGVVLYRLLYVLGRKVERSQ
jgi:tetrahydromethanopterin S-methyltransferase subunit E